MHIYYSYRPVTVTVDTLCRFGGNKCIVLIYILMLMQLTVTLYWLIFSKAFYRISEGVCCIRICFSCILVTGINLHLIQIGCGIVCTLYVFMVSSFYALV